MLPRERVLAALEHREPDRIPWGDLGSSTNIMASPAIYREMVYPWHKLHAAKAHSLGLKVLKHCCGHIWPVIRDIRNDARYAFANAAPGGGYIMGSTHSLAVDAKVENIMQMKRCRDEWGTYPIRPAAWGPME